MLYSEKLNNWLDHEETYKKESTWSNYYNLVHNHIYNELGHFEEKNLEDEVLQEFILNKLDHGRIDGHGGLSTKYVQDIITILKMTIDRKIDIKLPYSPPKMIEIFERPSQVKLINHLQEVISYKHFGILLVMHTGIRIGELCALKWSDINFDAQLLHIDKTMIRTYTKKKGSVLNITSPKSRSSIRTIPLDSWIMKYAYLLKGNDNEYILTGRVQYIEPNKYRLWYNTLLNNLGLEHRKFHALRHTFATQWIECGCDHKSLSEVLGHSNVATTMALYVHPNMSLKRKCMEMVADFLSH